MTENRPNAPSGEDPELVGGEIVSVEEGRVRVRLDSGAIGFAKSPEGATPDPPQVGSRVMFRVGSLDAAGFPTLGFAGPCDPAPATERPFDRDVVRLHNALANHHPSNSIRTVERVHLGEEQIRAWIVRVEERVDALRKSRAKRLNQEFYTA